MSPIEPTAALRAVLPGVPESIPVSRIDELWLFEPRLLNDREMGLIVLSIFPEDEEHADDRDIFTLEYQATSVRGAQRIASEFTEQGRAPADRIHRIIDGVLLRAGEEGDPHVYLLQGDEEQWSDLLRSTGAVELDPTNGE